MKKFKLFLENFLVYGLGGVISKIIPLIMLPIVTRIMPGTEYYGINDLFSTLVSFAGALAMMGMYDAMYRLFFEKDELIYKQEICSTTLIFSLISSMVVATVLICFKTLIAELFFKDAKYSYLVCLAAFSVILSAVNCIVTAPTRMQNKRRVFLVTNTLSPILSYSLAIPLLFWGYYVIALPIAGIVSVFLIMLIFVVLNKNWFDYRKFRLNYLKQLLVIAVPLLPNFLIYWIFNSCDRIMISSYLDVSASGIYSVGAKLGNVSQLIYTAFGGGWLYFAYSTMKDDDQVSTNSHIFEYLGIISYVSSMFVFALCRWIYNVMFVGDYVKGYIVSPYLFFAPLLQMLFQVAANQFMVLKKSWPSMFMLFGGAVVNILINIILIPRYGIEGAAIATLLGYLVSLIICVVVLCKMKLMIVSFRFGVASILMVIYIIFWRIFLIERVIFSIVLVFVISTIYVILYKEDLKILISGLNRKGKRM